MSTESPNSAHEGIKAIRDGFPTRVLPLTRIAELEADNAYLRSDHTRILLENTELKRHLTTVEHHYRLLYRSLNHARTTTESTPPS